MPTLHPMDPKRGRVGRPYRRLWALILRPGVSCWICGEPIAFGLRKWHPRGPSLDHVRPLSKGGDPLDLRNARPAHYGCNSARGNRERVITRDHHSEDWLS